MTEFWTPVDISITSNDAMLHLCKLDFKSYHAQPHLYPMFKGVHVPLFTREWEADVSVLCTHGFCLFSTDLVAKSRCGGANSKRMLLSEALVGDTCISHFRLHLTGKLIICCRRKLTTASVTQLYHQLHLSSMRVV